MEKKPTCLEQLQFMGQMYGVDGRKARRRGEQLLEELDLTTKRNQQDHTLSGGMKRRFNLALALVHNPDIQVSDEPEAGLDPQSRVKVREYIRSLGREKTVILTTPTWTKPTASLNVLPSLITVSCWCWIRLKRSNAVWGKGMCWRLTWAAKRLTKKRSWGRWNRERGLRTGSPDHLICGLFRCWCVVISTHSFESFVVLPPPAARSGCSRDYPIYWLKYCPV